MSTEEAKFRLSQALNELNTEDVAAVLKEHFNSVGVEELIRALREDDNAAEAFQQVLTPKAMEMLEKELAKYREVIGRKCAYCGAQQDNPCNTQTGRLLPGTFHVDRRT
jgi:hypothetical protein